MARAVQVARADPEGDRGGRVALVEDRVVPAGLAAARVVPAGTSDPAVGAGGIKN